jgi:5-methylcytosine-specific restriction protein A
MQQDGSTLRLREYAGAMLAQSAAARGYDHRWQVARAIFLAKNPLCIECRKDDRLTAATVVDHMTRHRGDKALFWDETNWQPRCKHDHDSKTVKAQ